MHQVSAVVGSGVAPRRLLGRLKFRIEISACALLVAAATSLLPAAEAGLTDTTSSPYAQVRSVGLDEVHWTRGFWADRFEICRRHTVPALEAIMEGTNYSQFYQNFRIAAGLAEGRHRGPPFNDGDFYKWLEAASAVVAVTKDAQLERRLDEIIADIARAQREDGYLHTPVLIA
jgi:DUF1680 family protein